MAYFPYAIMPLSPKQTPVGADPTVDGHRITSEQYNIHDEELQAIEGFVGKIDKTGKIRTGLFGNISDLIDQINIVCVEGIRSSSGAVQSGQSITFPENSIATYLGSSLAPYSSTIHVSSTSGFPQKGVISILNDVVQGKINANGKWVSTTTGGTSIVEWIRYDGKTPTSFLNCQRGYLNTTIGNHTGTVGNFSQPKTGNINLQDQCLIFNGFENNVCQFRNQGIRNASIYACSILNLIGSLEYIEDYIRLQPDAIRVVSGTNLASLFISTSDKLNILGTRSDGTLYLTSADANYRAINQLSPSEAYQWTNNSFSNGMIQLKSSSKDRVWPDGVIPVFSGKLSVQFSIGVLNGSRNNDDAASYNFLAAIAYLGADGTLYSFIDDTESGSEGKSLENILYYRTTLIPSVETFDERNN